MRSSNASANARRPLSAGCAAEDFSACRSAAALDSMSNAVPTILP